MSTRSFVNDVLEWDVRSWAPALEFWEQRGSDPRGLTALDLGAGGGGLSLYFASRGAYVICSDIADPSKLAGPLIARYGLTDRVRFSVQDATELDLPSASCDLVCFKSILGAVGRDGRVDRQEAAINEILRVLRPGGRLYFAENLAASRLHSWARRRFVRWGDSWNYLTLRHLDQLLSRFTNVTQGQSGFLAAFARSTNLKNTLSRVDSVVAPLIPPSQRYVGYGVAQK